MQCNLCTQEKGGRAKKGRRKAPKATAADGAAAPALAPSYDVLACEYHAAMVAGLSLICARAPAAPALPNPDTGGAAG